LPSAKEASWRRIVDEYASSGRSAKEFLPVEGDFTENVLLLAPED
jgi:hypothetical protein